MHGLQKIPIYFVIAFTSNTVALVVTKGVWPAH
jgi:hypothetical protein